MPQNAAGPRIEPLVSEPRVSGTRPAATAAPEPLDEPPVKCAVFHGLRAGGDGKLYAGPPAGEFCGASVAMRIAPAPPNLRATVASRSGTRWSGTPAIAEARVPRV